MAVRPSCHSSQAFSEDQRRNLIRPFIGALAAAMLLAGCGGDDEGSKATKTATAGQPATRTATREKPTAPTETTETGNTSTSPEDQPGGQGDEEPARSQALFTGRGGRVRPTVVRVPAYIAIRVELRSGAGAAYALRFNHRILKVDRTVGSVSSDFS